MSRNRNRFQSGSITVQFLVILVPVLLGFMGFAIDLGRLYLIRGELNQAAASMALAAAAQLNGTTNATTAADGAALTTIAASQSDSNTYNFGSIGVGQGTSVLTSAAPTIAYFDTLTTALAAYGQVGAASSYALPPRHVTVNLSADAPLLFWSLLSLGQSRKVSIAASAVAGVSAPVCTACAIVPFAIADASTGTEPMNFGYQVGSTYTLAYQCNGTPPAAYMPSTRIPYIIIDKTETGTPIATQFASDDDQLFRDGAQGLVPSRTTGISCSTVGNTEAIWASIPTTARACTVTTPLQQVEDALCGLSTRLTDATPNTCVTAIPDASTLAAAYAQDTDVTSNVDPLATDYTTYMGNNRRLITLPVVNDFVNRVVVGFRQFLLIPTPGMTANDPADPDGRFVAIYAGVVAPVAQGRFDGQCALTSGPGKVVMHQ